MTRTTKLLILLYFYAVVALPIYAYIDPGSGSLMLQLLLGGAAGLFVILRLNWHRLLVFLKIRKEDVNVDTAAPEKDRSEQGGA